MGCISSHIDCPTIESIESELQNSIRNIDISNRDLNAFVRIYKEEAVGYCKYIRQKLKNEGQLGKLGGMVVGLKDLICYKDHPVQASSRILEGFISSFSATVVDRLIDGSAIIIGHQNCDEFGMGATNEHSIYGPVKNGLDINRVPGGSSGGSAVAVQQGMCRISIGTDTGGSVRQPAAFCGVIGFKPSYGRISRHGIIAHASSFDTVGIIGKSIDDIENVFYVISGPDGRDHTAYDKRYNINGTVNLEHCKIVYLNEVMHYDGLQPGVRSALNRLFASLSNNKHDVTGVGFSLLDYCVPVYYTLTTAEASSNLARYDGIRYGYRTKEYSTLREMVCKTRSEGFGSEVKKRIVMGNFVLESNSKNGHYDKARYMRLCIKNKLDELLAKYDFLVLPTTSTTAFRFNDKPSDVQIRCADVFTTIASIAQLPAISIPYGIDDEGMPIGVQIITSMYNEKKLLTFSKYVLESC